MDERTSKGPKQRSRPEKQKGPVVAKDNRACCFWPFWCAALLLRRQVYGCVLAATVNLDFELETIAFIKRRHTRTLDGRDVHECVGLSVVALNEAKALHRVEELDSARRFLTGQLALRRAAAVTTAVAATIVAAEAAFAGFARCAFLDCHRFAVDLEIGGRNTTTAIDEREAHWLTFCKTGQTGLLDCRDVNEHILAAIITHDEAEALLRVEEFYDASRFANHLGRHAATAAKAAAATSTSTAATETAAAAATTAEAVAATGKAAAAAAAESVTAAGKTAATAAEPVSAAEAATIAEATAAAAIVAAETVALVPAAPAAFAAAPSIKTHCPVRLPARPS